MLGERALVEQTTAVLGLVASLQQAAMDGSAWPDLLERLALLTRSEAAALVVSGTTQAFVWLDPPVEAGVVGGQPRLHAWAAFEIETTVAVGPAEVTATALFDRMAFAREVWREAAVVLDKAGPVRRRVIVGLQRRVDAGGYGLVELAAVEQVLPHFALAVETRARLEAALRQAGLATGLLDRLALPVFLLDARCMVLQANTAAAALVAAGGLLALRRGRLECLDGDGARHLEATVRRLAAGMAVDAPVVVDGAAGIVARLWLSRLPSVDAAVLVLVQGNGRGRVALCPAETAPLCRLFALSPAEARLARALLDGATLADYAARVGISEGTARWTLKQVFQKTRTSRQAELVHLLATSPAALLRQPG